MTAVLRTLLGKLERAILLEADLLRRPEVDQPENNYRDFFESWLRLAENINQSGQLVMLFNAGAIPPNVKPCVKRRYGNSSNQEEFGL